MSLARAAADCKTVSKLSIVFDEAYYKSLPNSQSPLAAAVGAFVDEFMMDRFEWQVSASSQSNIANRF